MTKRTLASCWWLVASLLVLWGCQDEIRVGGGPARPRANARRAAQTASAGADAGVGDAAALPAPAPRYKEEDFVEAESNRDPFRGFAQSFQVRPTIVAQRRVLLPTTAIEQMRLIAIISGVERPRAMLLDPVGVGHVVERGDYIGRAEVVSTGGVEGMPVTLNWRVDRIRPNEVVLTREDPTAPNRPPLTRVIPLNETAPEDEAGAPMETAPTE